MPSLIFIVCLWWVFSPVPLLCSWALCTFSLQSSPAKKNIGFSDLFSTRKDQTKSRRSMMWKERTRTECSLTWNMPYSSRKLGRPDQEKAGSDCPTSAQNYLWSSNKEVLTSSPTFTAVLQETSPNTLKGTLGAMSSHQGKQQVTNWIICLEVWWMHWYFRNFSLKEEFKERNNIIWSVMWQLLGVRKKGK